MNAPAGEAFPLVAAGGAVRGPAAEPARALSECANEALACFGDDFGLRGEDPAGALTRLLDASLQACAAPGADDGARRRHLALFAQAVALADAVSERTMARRAQQLADCERALGRLREITTTAGLIDGVCDELVRSLGMKRAMLARVEAGMWRPWKGNSSLFDEPWVKHWIDQTIPLDDLTLETRLLSERRPALILDTTVPGIAQMVHQAGVRSYVVAPIMPGGRVVGFFHADHGPEGRACDEADRDALWSFAEGFGHLYERITLLEQLHARTERVRETFAGMSRALDQLTDAEPTLFRESAARASDRSAVPHGGHIRLEQFTARELEVLELMVAGARNGEIAQRLAITVGTVKSHVKNILAKLGVLNRSQAIALYLGAGSSGGAPRT